MHEITLARHNDLIDPLLRVWAWPIPVYLFLGGWVAGMMIIVAYYLLRGDYRKNATVCNLLPALSVILLSAGMAALFLDLEHKLYVWRLYTTFRISSPMSWGAWILLLVYPALVAALLLNPPRPLARLWPAVERVSEQLASSRVVRIIAWLNLVLGVALGIYTGVLLSTFAARPFWNSSLLGPLFLISGLSAAAAFTHLAAREPEERARMARTDNAFLASEVFLIGLYLIGLLSGSRASADAARLVLGGPFTGVFWVLVVGLGILMPLVVQSLAVAHRIRHTPIAPLFVLGGGLALRFVIVLVGQYSSWPKV